MGRPVRRPRPSSRPSPARRVRLVLCDLEERATPATFLVTTAADSGPGSFRQAITDAVAAPTNDTIAFDTAGVFSTPQTISLLTALPVIDGVGGGLTISGPGAANLTIRRDPAATGLFGIFFSTAPSLALSGMTVTGANTDTSGGALFATGTDPVVTLDGVVFSGNTAAFAGGAVLMDYFGFLTVRNSTISGNTAGTSGGGIYFFSSGSLVMENSTVSGNSSAGNSSDPTHRPGGGGIYFWGTAMPAPPAGFVPNTLVIRNSTISGNTAGGTTGAGGGIALSHFAAGSTLVVQNSTLTGNTAATSGGGIALVDTSPGALRVENCTITGNTANGTAAGTGGGGLARLGTASNVVTVANSVVSGNANANAPDILASSVTTTNVNFSAVGSPTGFTPSATSGNNLPFGADLQLGALADNGGPTQTILPAAGSPLVGAGSGSLVTPGVISDQRGFGYVRSYGGVDIGAVEVQPPGLPVGASAGPNVSTAGGTTYTFTVRYADPTGTNNGINSTSIVNNNAAVHVTGPNGFDVPATFRSIDDPSNGTPRTATYAITPPGGTWDAQDNGNYLVVVQSDQVADVDGNFVPTGPAGAFTVAVPNFTVRNANDSGPGSLREAIEFANANPGPNSISFAPSVFNTPRTISLLSALPAIPASGGRLTITGPGAGLLTVRRDAGAPTNFGILTSTAPVLTLTGFTIQGGRSDGDGGGLFASDVVLLDGMVFDGNTAVQEGGGIYMDVAGSLAVRNSTISGNTAGTDGGGIYFLSGGSLLVENSTISGNTASGTTAGGGGIYFLGEANPYPQPGFTAGTLLIRNSTISNNTTAGNGGGVLLRSFQGTLALQNSTLTGNTAAASGGAVAQTSGEGSIAVHGSTVFGNTANGTTSGTGGGGLARTPTAILDGGTITVANSVVSGNANANGPDILASSVTTTNVNFSAVGSGTGFTPSATSGNNLPFGLELGLGALGNYGGRTQTMAPLQNSPLVGAGSNALTPAGLTTDQRGTGFDRVAGGTVDIGAVESQSPGVTVTRAAGQTDPTSSGPITFAVAFAAPVTGFAAGDVSFAGSTVGGTLSADVTGSGATYTVSVTGMAGAGTVVVSVPAGAATDASGNPNLASTGTGNVVRFDAVAPTVTINQAAGQADPVGGGPVAFDVLFSEPVTGFTAADVDLSGSTTGGPLVAQVTGSGAAYQVTVTGMTGPGLVTASIPAGAAADLAGNPSASSTSTDNSVTFDPVVPTVTINQAVGQADPTSAASIVFDVRFSKPVTGFDAADVSFAGSTVHGSLAADVAGSGTNYTVTVTGMLGNGTVAAGIPAGAAFDAVGHGNDQSTSIDNTVTFVDVPGSLQFASATFATTEVAGTVAVTVTRTGGGAGPVTVDYATGGGTATPGPAADYLPASGTLSWADGEAGPKSFLLTLLDDSIVEGDETIDLALTNPTGGAALGAQSTAEILLADHEEGVLSFEPPVPVAEGAGSATITVTRTGGTGGLVSVNYATADGTARSTGQQPDYNSAAGTLTWADGEGGSKTFTVPIVDDNFNEGRETILLSLSNPTGGAAAGPGATLVILPSDPRPAGTLLDEDGDFGTVKLTGPGQLGFYLTDPDGNGRGPIELIEVSGTNPLLSAVTVTVQKGALSTADGRVTLGGVTGSGLKAITAAKSNLDADVANLTGPVGINLTGPLGLLVVGDVRNGADIIAAGTPPQKTRIQAGVIDDGTTIQTGSALAGLTAVRIGDGTITAPSVGTITVRGNLLKGVIGSFESDVTVSGAGLLAGQPALGTLWAAGPIVGDISVTAGRVGLVRGAGFTGRLRADSIRVLNVQGNLTGAVTVTGTGVLAGRPALGTLTVTGAVLGTDISVAGNVSAVTVGEFLDSGLFAGYDDATGTFGPVATVGSFRVTGLIDAFQNGKVYASTVKVVVLRTVGSTIGGDPFGFYADVGFGSLRVLDPRHPFVYNPSPTAPNPQGFENFEVKVV